MYLKIAKKLKPLPEALFMALCVAFIVKTRQLLLEKAYRNIKSENFVSRQHLRSCAKVIYCQTALIDFPSKVKISGVRNWLFLPPSPALPSLQSFQLI